MGVRPVNCPGRELPWRAPSAAVADEDRRQGGTVISGTVNQFGVRPDERDHDRGSSAPAAAASSAVEISRMRYFWTLPVTVIGKPSTILQYRGIL